MIKSFKINADLASYDESFKKLHGFLPNYEYVYMHKMTKDIPLVIAFNDTTDHSTRVDYFNSFDLSKYKDRIINLDILIRDIDIAKKYGIDNISIIKPSGEVLLLKKSFKLNSVFTDMYFETHQPNWERSLEPKNQPERTLDPALRIVNIDDMFDNNVTKPKNKKELSKKLKNIKDKSTTSTGYGIPKKKFNFVVDNPGVGNGSLWPSNQNEVSEQNRTRPAPTEKPQSRNLETNVEWLQKLSFKLKSDKVLFENKWKTILSTSDGYVYVDNPDGVAMLPFRTVDGSKEYLVRYEANQLFGKMWTVITGRRDAAEHILESAMRELYEEAGIKIDDTSEFIDLGKIFIGKDNKNPDYLYAVNVTSKVQEEPKGDGSSYEADSYNEWVDINRLKELVLESGDCYLSSIVAKYLLTTNESTDSTIIDKKSFKFKSDEIGNINLDEQDHMLIPRRDLDDGFHKRKVQYPGEGHFPFMRSKQPGEGLSKIPIKDLPIKPSFETDPRVLKQYDGDKIKPSKVKFKYGNDETDKKKVKREQNWGSFLYSLGANLEEYKERLLNIAADVWQKKGVSREEIADKWDKLSDELNSAKREKFIAIYNQYATDLYGPYSEFRERVSGVEKDEALNPQPYYGDSNVYPYKGTGPGVSSPTMYDNTGVMTREVRVADEQKEFTMREATAIGYTLGIDFEEIDPEQFRLGLSVELEHGTIDPDTNVTYDDLLATGKIAWRHLKEVRDYYTRLEQVETKKSFKLTSDFIGTTADEFYSKIAASIKSVLSGGKFTGAPCQQQVANAILLNHNAADIIVLYSSNGKVVHTVLENSNGRVVADSNIQNRSWYITQLVESNRKLVNDLLNEYNISIVDILNFKKECKSFKLTSTVDIDNDDTFKHSLYHKLSAKDNGKEVGYLVYGIDDATIYVKAIGVEELYRRQHIADRMLNFVKNEFSNRIIDWGVTTLDGSEFKKYIETKSFKLKAQDKDKPVISPEAYDAFAEKGYVFKNYQLGAEQIEEAIEKGKDLSILLKYQKLTDDQKKRAIQRSLEKGVALVYIYEKEKANLTDEQIKFLITKLHKKALDDGTNIIYLLKKFQLTIEQKDALVTRAIKDGIGLHYMFKNRLLSPDQRAFAVSKAIETGYGLVDLLKYEKLSEEQKQKIINKCISRGVALIYLLEKETLSDDQKKVIFDKALKEGVGYHYILKRYKLHPNQVAMAIRKSKHDIDNLKYILKFQETTTEQKQYIDSRIEIEKKEIERQRMKEKYGAKNDAEELFMSPGCAGFEELQNFFKDASDDEVIQMYELIEVDKMDDAKKLLEDWVGYEIS